MLTTLSRCSRELREEPASRGNCDYDEDDHDDDNEEDRKPRAADAALFQKRGKGLVAPYNS